MLEQLGQLQHHLVCNILKESKGRNTKIITKKNTDLIFVGYQAKVCSLWMNKDEMNDLVSPWNPGKG